MLDLEITSDCYAIVKRALMQSGLRINDLPEESYLSLLMPTRRNGIPMLAFFSAPRLNNVGEMVCQGAPDRWGSFLLNGILFQYALCLAQPLPLTTDNVPRQFARSGLPLSSAIHAMENAEREIASGLVRFFNAEEVTNVKRNQLLHALKEAIPDGLWKDYEALCPDFFQWLVDDAKALAE